MGRALAPAWSDVRPEVSVAFPTNSDKTNRDNRSQVELVAHGRALVLLRDSLHAGAAHGRFDRNRLIDTVRVPESEMQAFAFALFRSTRPAPTRSPDA